MDTDIFKITIHMVSSLDGMIAKKDNSTEWFETADHYEKGATVTHEQSEAFLKAIDCYVMGAATYLHALELSKTYGWPYGDTPTIVLSQRNLPVERTNVEIYNGDLNSLVNTRLKKQYKNVWVAGGAKLAKGFIDAKLAHELRLSVLPIILGEGLKLFNQPGQEQALHLKDITAYKSGMVELVYEIKK